MTIDVWSQRWFDLGGDSRWVCCHPHLGYVEWVMPKPQTQDHGCVVIPSGCIAYLLGNDNLEARKLHAPHHIWCFRDKYTWNLSTIIHMHAHSFKPKMNVCTFFYAPRWVWMNYTFYDITYLLVDDKLETRKLHTPQNTWCLWNKIH